MRNSLLLLFICLSICSKGQNIVPKYLQLNDKVPELTFQVLEREELASIQLSQHRGKVIILEFWATFCGPCIPAMDHLASIQKEFPNDLVTYAITEESAPVVQKYLSKRPTSLQIALDPSGQLNQLFYHQFMPHTVLIGPDGFIKAITSPDQITKEVIYITKSGADPAIALKAEFKPKDINANALGVVNFDQETILKVNVSPAKVGVQTQVRKVSKTEYQFVNCTVPVIYNSLLQSVKGNKLPKDCLEVGPENQSLLKAENAYCLEIKVPAHLEYEIEEIALDHIQKVFQLEPRIEARGRNTLVLKNMEAFEEPQNLTALKSFSALEVSNYLWDQKLIPFPIELSGTERPFRGTIPSQVPEVKLFLDQNGYYLQPKRIEKQCLILHKEGRAPTFSNNF